MEPGRATCAPVKGYLSWFINLNVTVVLFFYHPAHIVSWKVICHAVAKSSSLFDQQILTLFHNACLFIWLMPRIGMNINRSDRWNTTHSRGLLLQHWAINPGYSSKNGNLFWRRAIDFKNPSNPNHLSKFHHLRANPYQSTSRFMDFFPSFSDDTSMLMLMYIVHTVGYRLSPFQSRIQ